MCRDADTSHLAVKRHPDRWAGRAKPDCINQANCALWSGFRLHRVGHGGIPLMLMVICTDSVLLAGQRGGQAVRSIPPSSATSFNVVTAAFDSIHSLLAFLREAELKSLWYCKQLCLGDER